MAKLFFRYGAMGCGKTLHLLQVAYNYEKRDMPVCVAKPNIDTKQGTKVVTRLGLERDTDICFSTNADLYQIIQTKYYFANCILIDEAQFLTKAQVEQLLDVTVDLNIPVIAYGLRLNSNLTDKGFEGATRLLQLAHEIEELETICECGRKATLTGRFSNGKILVNEPPILIDGKRANTEYRALCPVCYKRYKQGITTPEQINDWRLP